MDFKLVNGDYVPNGFGAMQSVTENDELLQRILICLKARRGSYVLMPKLGSRLNLLHREKPSNQKSVAEQYIIEALENIPVKVENVAVIRDEEKVFLEISVSNGNGILDFTVDIGGG